MGTKLREAREEKRMSQEELAKLSGISRSTISGLENGEERNVTVKTLKLIAAALGKTVQEIFFAEVA